MGERNWREVVKSYKLPVIRKVSTRDIMYNMINDSHCCMLYMKVKSVKNFFPFYFVSV